MTRYGEQRIVALAAASAVGVCVFLVFVALVSSRTPSPPPIPQTEAAAGPPWDAAPADGSLGDNAHLIADLAGPEVPIVLDTASVPLAPAMGEAGTSTPPSAPAAVSERTAGTPTVALAPPTPTAARDVGRGTDPAPRLLIEMTGQIPPKSTDFALALRKGVRHVALLGALTAEEKAAPPPVSGIDADTARKLTRALTQVVNVRTVRAGWPYRVLFTPDGQLVEFALHMDALTHFAVKPDAKGRLQAQRVEAELETRTEEISGYVQTTLDAALRALGERPALLTRMLDFFGPSIDFNRDTRPGDRFRLIIEKRYHNGGFARYGHIRVGQYDSRKLGLKQAFLFIPDDGSKPQVYDIHGNSLKRVTLAPPLDKLKVASPYGWRMHPVFHERRMHEGVDYDAQTGDPIYSSGDGVVIQAGDLGGCGRTVTVEHRPGLATRYCHMSKILVQVGQRVRQRQVLGRVGCTGTCTGAHLHYEVLVNGRQVNPARRIEEKGEPVPPALRREFEEQVASLGRRIEAVAWATPTTMRATAANGGAAPGAFGQ